MGSCFDNGVLRIVVTGCPAALELSGEIDESGYQGLLASFEEIMSGDGDGDGDVRLRATELAYCDMAGLRAIVGLAERIAPQGRRLLVRDLPGHLCTLLRIVGWETTTGLVLENGSVSG